MKKNILRALCAFALLGIVTAVAMGAYSAAFDGETVYAWQRVYFAHGDEITLFSADGAVLQTLRPDENGIAASNLLPEGEYYAFSDDSCVRFFLHSDCSVTVEGGRGWTDGKYLHLTEAAVGTVRAEFLAQKDGFCVLTLTDGETERTTAVNCRTGQTATGEFLGVPYGNYSLRAESGRTVRVTVDENTPCVLIALGNTEE